MESHFMNYPSPRGVHVPETYASDDSYDLYRPPRRNRYSRSVRQTPIRRDVTWISSPEPTPQTPHAPPTPWMPPPQAPSSPFRPASAAPPSPAPTVGEHMALDDFDFEVVDPYRPQRKRGGLFRSLWNGLRKLSGHDYMPSPHSSRRGSYQSQTMEMPAPVRSGTSEGTQYVDPSPTDEQQHGPSPYGSPYAHPSQLGGPSVPGSRRASPVPSMKMPSVRGSPVAVPSALASPYVRSPKSSATPAVIPSGLRRSPSPSLASSSDTAPPIRVVSPSVPPSPRPSSRRSARIATPAIPIMRSPPGGSEPGLTPAAPIDEGSQTLHEPMPAPVLPRLDTQLGPALPPAAVDLQVGRVQGPTSPNGSLARFRQFVAGLDRLPWTSDQIADEYVPADNPRSRLRRQVKQGAEPSWYNPRAEVTERPAYLSEWDMWAMQTAAELWNGKTGMGTGTRPGEWGVPVMYPHGYVGMVYPPR